ncbi:MAG TPA: FKBP-type peptidyl-prolyl cis-trans isomerase [Saprospiraceae bacterium]|nr:FKBP-type peptidyl-prolyl cis-trans isomerase [Saprospiraceae bacterium]
MKYLIALSVFLCLPIWPALAGNNANTPLISQQQKLGYALGTDIGYSLKEMTTDIDINSLTVGIKDAFEQKKLRLSFGEIKQLKAKLSHHSKLEKKIKHDKFVSESIQKGISFLEKNKQKNGVKVTKGGLQYSIISKGSGTKPSIDDYVIVSYKGKLIDGTVFKLVKPEDAKPKAVKNFIAGVQEGLQLMSEGGHYKLFVPAHLAYSYKRHGTLIPPYSVLIYDIILQKVIKRGTNRNKLISKSIAPPNSLTTPIIDARHTVSNRIAEEITSLPKSKIDLSRIRLSSLESASYSVYNVYTAKINPNTKKVDIERLCDTISTRQFAHTCKKIMYSRLFYIRKLIHKDKVYKAGFFSAKRKVDEKGKKATVTWLDKFVKKDNSVIENDKAIEMEFKKVHGGWKLNNLVLKK